MFAREVNLFLMALTFYTRVSWFQPKHYDEALLSRSNRYLTLVGLLLGLVVGLIGAVALRIFPVNVSAWLVVFSSMLLTGAFHEDGLSDTFDALGAWQLETRLAIMKDSRIGTYGAAIMIFSIGLRYLFWLAIPPSHWLVTALLVHTLSRFMPLLVIRSLSYVRADAASKVKPVAKALAGIDFAVAGFIALTLLVFAGYWFSVATVLVLVGVFVIAAILIIRWFRRFLGGYTGDLLGASQQFGEWVVLACLTVMLN